MRLVTAATDVPATVHRHLLPHERHVTSTRQHPALLIAPSALTFAGLLAAVILSMTILLGKTDLTLAVWALWFILLLRAIWKGISWTVNFFVVTSDRIILATGFLSTKVAIIPLQTINNLSLQRSPGGQLFGYGSFLVESGAPDQVLQKLDYIPDLEQLYLKVCDMIFETEQTPCSLCAGAGKVFRHPDDQRAIPAGSSEHYEPDDFRRQREYLLVRGYAEITCPKCDGKGTVDY
jgi:membrane protein YdbS with pleckstrin-like domain